MNTYDRLVALENIRRIVLLELPPEKLNIKLESAIDDIRSINQLAELGYVTISDLAKIDSSSTITARTASTIITSLDYLLEDSLLLARVENITIEEMLDSLKSNQKRVLLESYGLLHEKSSLQGIGNVLGVTRERVRQVRNAGLHKLRKRFDPMSSEQIQRLLAYARATTRLEDIDDITDIYKNTEIIEMLKDAFPSLSITIHENKYLSTKVLIEVSRVHPFDEKIESIIDTLQYQIGFVPIDDVADNFSLDPRIILSLKNTATEDGHIALESNHNIFQRVFDVVVETLREEGKPMTTQQIAEKSGLRLGQVRGVVMRKEKHTFANVGQSTYALTEWGFSELPTDELAYRYIKDSGEPRLAKQVLRYVSSHKKIEDSSILASISLDQRIVPIRPGIYSLKEWGDENYYTHRNFEIKCTDGIIEVLSEAQRPMTIKEVLEVFGEKYGDKITDSYQTLNATMKKLESKNIVKTLPYGKGKVRFKITSKWT